MTAHATVSNTNTMVWFLGNMEFGRPLSTPAIPLDLVNNHVGQMYRGNSAQSWFSSASKTQGVVDVTANKVFRLTAAQDVGNRNYDITVRQGGRVHVFRVRDCNHAKHAVNRLMKRLHEVGNGFGTPFTVTSDVVYEEPVQIPNTDAAPMYELFVASNIGTAFGGQLFKQSRDVFELAKDGQTIFNSLSPVNPSTSVWIRQTSASGQHSIVVRIDEKGTTFA